MLYLREYFSQNLFLLFQDKLVLMCAVGRRDIANIKKLIKNIDREAFVIVTNSREVLGIGFKQ